MSTTPLAKRRKTELKELAAQLGLAADGLREDIADRIKSHVAKHGTSDPSLQDLVREASPRASGRRSTESSRLANLSSANEDDDTSDGAYSRSLRSSPLKAKVASRSLRRTDSDSESAEDPLSVHQVRNFMENMQEDVDEAAELAHSIEHSLQEKIMSGKAHLRRASKDIASTVSHAIGGAKVVVNEAAEKAKDIRRGSSSRYSHDDDEEGRHGHRHHRHRHHLHRHGEDEEGFLSWMVGEVKHRFVECAGTCGFSMCMSRNWQKLHDLGSTSTGFVWVMFLLELAVFMTAAYSQHEHQDEESWTSCLSFLTNWPNFLLPFFSYYGALFVLPTLLSQLFNVDRTRKLRADSEDHRHPHVMTGVLSRTTTSGLSYFVFKFALTYLLSQYALHHVHHGHHLGETTSRLAELAKDAAASAGFGSAGDHGQYHMLSACEFVAEVFRFVPASLNLATAGVGTVLALAETAVSRRR